MSDTTYPQLSLIGDETSGYFPRLQMDASSSANPKTLFELVSDKSVEHNATVPFVVSSIITKVDSRATATLSWKGEPAAPLDADGVTAGLGPGVMMKDCQFTIVVTLSVPAMAEGFDPGWTPGTNSENLATFTLDPYVRIRRSGYSLTVAPPKS